MAYDGAMYGDRPPTTVAELVAYTKKELDADAERQAKVSAVGVGGLESQTGATLDLSRKDIHALPLEVITLIKDKVERLALSHNPQISVPTQIVQCDRLRYLNMRWNHLKSFPEAVLQLSSLEILDLSMNSIASIPEEIKNMTSLKFLAVARNKITRLPLALGEMASLSKLKFHENPIVFPPPDAIMPQHNHMASSIEWDKNVCQQVKRFLKDAALRERLRTTSEEDLSESVAETRRPSKRSVTGRRFPIRPSISGIENLEELKSRSPNDVPPVPQRTHMRNLSTNGPAGRRPGITPLLTGGNDISRSRSETVSSSASIRSRRQGFVSRKIAVDGSGAPEANQMAHPHLGQAPTVQSSHVRGTSSISMLNGFLTASSGGETSSGAVSPIDGGISRFGSVRRLSSLPENRNSKAQTSDAVRAGKRLLFSLFQLHGPASEVTRTIKEGTPRRSVLERQLYSANAHAEELDRLLNRLEGSFEDINGRCDERDVKSIALICVAVLKAYSSVAKELKQHTHKIVSLTDSVYVRCLMTQIYMTMVESRNICSILGFKTNTVTPQTGQRASRAWSSRTVTPTKAKPLNSRRLRGATILQSMSSNAALRTVAPPVPLHTSGSRTNTMSSVSSATPHSSDSFPALPSSTLPSRSNTMRSTMDDRDHDEQFDRIFLKLRNACELAAQSLPRCRTEFMGRKDSAENASLPQTAHHWALAISKCDAVIAANNALMNRLRFVKLKDPGLRSQRDFWQLCDNFVHNWTDLATEIKDISQQRIDIATVRIAMRPVQKAVKEVSRTISESPLYHQAIRPGVPSPAGGTHGLTPPFPSGGNTAFAQPAGQGNGPHSRYVTPVPATPLSAALGPAVQATVANMGHRPPETFQHSLPGNGVPARFERTDTLVQPLNHGRR